MKSKKLVCRYLPICRGCPLGRFDFETQQSIKKKKFFDRLNSDLLAGITDSTRFEYVFPVFDNYRVRSDFIYLDGRMGWYDDKKQFFSVESCSLHDSKLTELIQLTSRNPLLIKKGSLRFRVGPNNLKGIWLDLANLDIKQLLDTPCSLDFFFDNDIVLEMGQKGKRVLRAEDNTYRFMDPKPLPWFETRFREQSVPLYSLISSFTQTNPRLNIQMIQIIGEMLGRTSFDEAVEFGCGVGNFTAFLSEISRHVVVIENDFRNLIPLRKNIELFGIKDRVQVYEKLSFFQASGHLTSNKRLYLVNPSRSGVGSLFDIPIKSDHVLYISCHLESFVADSKKLVDQGFIIEKTVLYDQFPHSEHFEIITYFRRK